MNPILRTGQGNTDDETLRVVLASDSPGVGGGGSGGATEAKQDTQITKLTSIESKADAVARALGVGSGGVGVSYGIVIATTAANGTDWTAYGSTTANTLTLLNNSGTSIGVRYGTGSAFFLATGQIITIPVSNTNEVSIRRQDNSTVVVAVQGFFTAN